MDNDYILKELHHLTTYCLCLNLKKDELETINEAFSYGIRAITMNNDRYSQDLIDEYRERFGKLDIKICSQMRKYELPYERQQKSIRALNNFKNDLEK